MSTTRVDEPRAGAEDASAPGAEDAAPRAGETWERFLNERAREAACPQRVRWRDEEGL